MEERDRNFVTVRKINTLEESLKLFDKSCLLEQLDVNLELVRKEKETKEQHLRLLKSADKDLLKLSQIHHPDKAIGEKKSDQEVANAQNLQTALNATRSVLKTLTEVFLKDIDVHYKYEFFAKLNTSTLINEKQIDLEINNVLCKISRLSEVKRVNIIGEIRKFLQESRECLRNFLRGRNHDFVRHRNHALRHLHKCIDGYKMHATECKLIVEECSIDKDENTKAAMQKIYEESQRESKFLQNLEIVAKRSLDGAFEIFPTYKFREYYFMQLVNYEPVESKEHEYFVLPFILYVDVLLMCSVMVDKKLRGMKLVTKIEEFFDYCFGDGVEESNNFIKEPALLEAYHLVSYFLNKNRYKRQVQSLLKNKFHNTTDNSIREAFKETVEEIEQILDKQFDINSYKEGKSNREQFNDRLFELNNSMAEFKEEETNLLEKIKLYEKETDEIRKEYLELFGKNEETDQKYRDFFFKSEDSGENVETESVQNVEEQEKTVQKNIKENNRFSERSFGNENTNQTKEIADDQSHDTFKEKKETSKGEAEKTSGFSFDQLHKKLLNGQLFEHVFKESAETNKTQSNTKANSKSPRYCYGNETTNQTTQMVKDQRHDFSKEHNESEEIHAEETPSFNRDQQHKESLTDQPLEHFYLEPGEADKNQQNIKVNNTSSESIFGNKTSDLTAKMANDQGHDFLKEHDQCPNVNDEETPCSNRYQLHKESSSGQSQERDFKKLGETEKNQQNIEANKTCSESISSNKSSDLRAQKANDQCHDFSKEHDECPEVNDEETPCSNRHQLHKDSLSGQLQERDFKKPGADKIQQNVKANNTWSENISGNKIVDLKAQMADDQCHNFPKEYDESPNLNAEETPSNRHHMHKESFSGQLQERDFKETEESDKNQQNIKANNTFPESIPYSKTANKTVQMADNQCYDFPKEHDECSKLHAEESL